MRLKSLYDSSRDFLNFIVTGNSGVKNYDITSVCNLKCSFCYYYSESDKKIADSKSDEEYISFFNNEKANNVHSVFLTGGEPSLKQNLLQAADSIFSNVFIISNGIIKIAANIKCKIFVSLDGPKDIHNKLRGVNCFDKIIKNISSDKRVIIASTLSLNNYQYIEEIYSIAKKANVRGITFSLVTSNDYNDPILLRDVDLDIAIGKLEALRKKDPSFVLLSKKMISQFKHKYHIKNCLLRKGYVLSHNVDFKIKNPCVLGEGIDCRTCGCSVPIILYCMKKLDKETFQVAAKLF
jgi:sulfatase maturation enzyme AslB (radical SAM superfamily)